MENKGFRRVKIEYRGIKKFIIAPVSLSVDDIENVLRISRGYLFQYVYTELIISQIYTLVIEDAIKKKDIFKHLVKKRWNECVLATKRIIGCFNDDFSDDNFCYEYAATSYDNISGDIYKLRDLLAQKLNNLGIKQAGLYANAIMLYNLIMLSIKTYDFLMQDIKERYGINVAIIFSKFRNTEAEAKAFDLLCAILGKDFFIVAPHIDGKEMRECYERIQKGIFDTTTMNEAAKNALDSSSLNNENAGNYYSEEDIMKGVI